MITTFTMNYKNVLRTSLTFYLYIVSFKQMDYCKISNESTNEQLNLQYLKDVNLRIIHYIYTRPIKILLKQHFETEL